MRGVSQQNQSWSSQANSTAASSGYQSAMQNHQPPTAFHAHPPPSSPQSMPMHQQPQQPLYSSAMPPSLQSNMPPGSQPSMMPPSSQFQMMSLGSQPPMMSSSQPSMMPPSSQPHMMPPSSQPHMMPPSSQPHMMPPSSQPHMMPPSSQPPMMPPSSQPPMMPPSSQPPMMPLSSQPPMMPPNMRQMAPLGGPPVPGNYAQPQTPAGMPLPPRGPMPPQNSAPSLGKPPPPAVGQSGDSGWAQQPPPQPPGYPGGMAPPQPQQSRVLDPDQMPSAVQVMEDDRKKNSGQFETGQRGQAPPLVTTEFVAVDQGNCSPRFLRATLYNVPCTAEMLKATQIPFGLVVSPMAEPEAGEQPLYISDLGSSGPVRCIRCKAYMSPYMTWIDGGRRFQCALCGGSTETPETYFAHLDHTGRRVDTYQRPELHLGSYELLATVDYCKLGQLPGRPALVFMIDVSYRSVRSGLLSLVCSRIKRLLADAMPRESGAPEGSPSPLRVGFVTYDRVLHYYNLGPGLSQPQMMLVTDLEEAFVPLVDGFLVDIGESEAQIDQLLETIPVMFKDARDTETILGPVIDSGIDAFKSAQCPGKLIVFHTGLPTVEAPGCLKNRDDRKLLGSDKEKTLLTPQTSYYTDLGRRCVEAGVGVDLFLCCDAYLDLATIGQVPFISGGSVYKYTYFQAATHGRQLLRDLESAVRGTVAFDCVMRVRTSAGTRPVEFYGGMHMVNTTDVETGVFEADKAVAIEIRHDDKLNEGEPVIVQCALLYTSVAGQRRLRIHNLALGSTNQMADAFRSAELDTMINLVSKMSIRQALKRNPKEVRDSLISRCSGILAAYRKNCATNSGPGQLILPEAMKLLPLYTNAIIKNDALQGASEISTDDRSYLMILCSTMTVPASNVFFYPRLLPLSELRQDGGTPTLVRCSAERLMQNRAYLLENGIVIFLWLGASVDLHWVNQVFGVSSLAEINSDKTDLPELDNETSVAVRRLVGDIRRRRKRHMRLHVVRARDKLEPWFLNFLVEDRGTGNGSTSYVDFLLHVHKEIRALLS